MLNRFNSDSNILKGSQILSLETGNIPDTSEEEIEEDLRVLKEHQLEWAQDFPLSSRIQLLEEVLANVVKYRDEWIQLDLKARHVPEGHYSMNESAPLGPIGAEFLIRDYITSLKKLEEHGGTKPMAPARQDGDRIVIDSFPRTETDKQMFPDVRAEIHLMHNTYVEELPSLQAAVYKDPHYEGGLSLILGAGNVAHLTLRDAFHKLFNEKKVIIIKANPVLEYLGPLLNKILEPFVRLGFVRIVSGGSKEGKILSTHSDIDDIIMTGSDKTFESIVYGPGESGQKNKEKDLRINNKPVSGELGDVSPVIVIPGEWSEEDFDYHAELLLQMMTIANGYACLATRVVILPKNWEGSKILMNKLKDLMEKSQQGINYYPGTDQTIQEVLECYPNALKFGKWTKDSQPLIFATDLDPTKNEPAFTREFWMTFAGQVSLEGDTPEQFLRNAIKFANQRLWGTLVATLFVDPVTLKSLEDTGVMKKAIDDLHYGNVTINVWPVITALAGQNSEGGYPGSTYNDIQSGNIITRNSLMLDKIEKTVFYGPFKPA
jgi:hypothetical protein